jgi:hypothetical protein
VNEIERIDDRRPVELHYHEAPAPRLGWVTWKLAAAIGVPMMALWPGLAILSTDSTVSKWTIVLFYVVALATVAVVALVVLLIRADLADSRRLDERNRRSR